MIQRWNDLFTLSRGLLAFDRPDFGLTERKLSKYHAVAKEKQRKGSKCQHERM